MFVLLASLILGACSSDDDNDSKASAYTETEQSETPKWQVDWSNNQDRPNWTEPDASNFENWTFVMVQIEEALQPYVSGDDMMAVFADDVLCGLARPAISVNGSQKVNTSFLMKIYDLPKGPAQFTATLQYYCKKLNHIFTLSEVVTVDTDLSLGIDEDYVPPFTEGSAKYPVVKTVSVEGILSRAGITPSQGGMVGVFAGDECRGTAQLSATGATSLVVYGRTAGETLSLRYYDAEKGRLFTIADAVKL